MAGGTIKKEMVASYTVEITGIQRTKREIARLDGAIRELRAGNYSGTSSVTVLSSVGSKDILATKVDDLEGRVQEAAQKAMISSMDLGKKVQSDALRAATTQTGLAGKSHSPGGRAGGPGRDDTGNMIKAIARNVEVFKRASSTLITGWHGWGTEGRGHFPFQEKGTRKSRRGRGVPAANSLGQSIPTVRENLKRELGKLKK